MTATTTAKLSTSAGEYPHMGTLPIAANTLLLRNTMVSMNASGNAVAPSDGDGLPVIGVSSNTYDNRTGSEAGGNAGDLNAELKYGVWGWAISGATPKPTDVVYAVDNQTVSLSEYGASGRRGVAGIVSEIGADGLCYVCMGPHMAASASSGGAGEVVVPLTAFRILSSGAVTGVFSAGVSDGYEVADSEALCIRFNDDTTAALIASVPLPADLDGSTDVTVHVLGARVGSSDPTATLTIGAFFQVTGAAHSADANCGGSSTAFDGATTVLTEETLTIAAADVPDGPAVLTLTMVPSAALDDDDLRVFGVRVTFGKKLI